MFLLIAILWTKLERPRALYNVAGKKETNWEKDLLFLEFSIIYNKDWLEKENMMMVVSCMPLWDLQ